MNSNNEKHFSRRLNVQVCELLQVLTKANIKTCSPYVLACVLDLLDSVKQMDV